VDLLNKFDEILEKIISKSSILTFGEKPAKKQTTPTKEPKTSPKTPNVELITAILEITKLILANTRVGTICYSSVGVSSNNY